MTIFSIICSAIFLFLMMRNIGAAMELKRYAKEKTLYVMTDTRRWVLIARIIAALLLIAIFAIFIYYKVILSFCALFR